MLGNLLKLFMANGSLYYQKLIELILKQIKNINRDILIKNKIIQIKMQKTEITLSHI